MGIITMLTWIIWNERNVKDFWGTFTMPTCILSEKKNEVVNWVIAGAKHFGILV